MNFREWTQDRASWLDRLICRFRGHGPAESLMKPGVFYRWCWRCGGDL